MYVADSQSGSASSSTSSDAAVAALRKVLELLPDNVDALHMIGVIFLDDGKVCATALVRACYHLRLHDYTHDHESILRLYIYIYIYVYDYESEYYECSSS